MNRSLHTMTIIVLLVFAQCVLVPSSWAKEDNRDTASEAGLGIASVLVSIPYGALKVAYAVAGAVTGGFAYVFTGGNLKAAQSVWDTSLRGTYIITPDHLRGDKPIRFLGVPPEAEGQSTAASQSSPSGQGSQFSNEGSPMIPSGQAPAMQSGPATAPTP